MFSSIAINNNHADKSLPALLLLPSVIHFEARQQNAAEEFPHHGYEVQGDNCNGDIYYSRQQLLPQQLLPVHLPRMEQTTQTHAPSSLDTASEKVNTLTPITADSTTLHYEASYSTPRSPESGTAKSVSPPLPESAQLAVPQDQSHLTASSPSSINQEPTVITASKYKRQRTGPSCDICRSKKIKCDATITILFQDPSVTRSYSNQLHSQVSVSDLSRETFTQIPKDIRKALLTKELLLLKHIDKLIAFKPCTSCSKRKNCVCSFSKGFTRADINVFTNLCMKFGKRSSIEHFNIEDYRKCGYQV
ncbi:HFL046Wp [Eremothecium sinecaudum]|uniref:HFL046Wp n=1 Tax=Eremothecium sinecaudum TaxID=45286 RepID=A0A120K2K2_9SACH|nr:HFL046Wp [Eremothecium sinecaudum]AMD21810.1 HFL046Wp [Eremothecium sinecaudum]